MAMNKALLDVLACPKCRGGVRVKGMFVICDKCRLAYPILDRDVADMIASDAWPLEKAKKSGFKHREKL